MSAFLGLESINKNSGLHKSSSVYQHFVDPESKSPGMETSQGHYIKKRSLIPLLAHLSEVAGCSEKESEFHKQKAAGQV